MVVLAERWRSLLIGLQCIWAIWSGLFENHHGLRCYPYRTNRWGENGSGCCLPHSTVFGLCSARTPAPLMRSAGYAACLRPDSKRQVQSQTSHSRSSNFDILAIWTSTRLKTCWWSVVIVIILKTITVSLNCLAKWLRIKSSIFQTWKSLSNRWPQWCTSKTRALHLSHTGYGSWASPWYSSPSCWPKIPKLNLWESLMIWWFDHRIGFQKTIEMWLRNKVWWSPKSILARVCVEFST